LNNEQGKKQLAKWFEQLTRRFGELARRTPLEQQLRQLLERAHALGQPGRRSLELEQPLLRRQPRQLALRQSLNDLEVPKTSAAPAFRREAGAASSFCPRCP